MSKQTFEDYLRDQHAEDYIGLDDDMADAFEDWLSGLDVSDVIQYAELYGGHQFNAGMKEVIGRI